jgi:diguanylate cyclase (GGDEF)-like protein/PAS domain S-box-containing protein
MIGGGSDYSHLKNEALVKATAAPRVRSEFVRLAVVLALLAAIVPAIGLTVLTIEVRTDEGEATENLQVIADLKAAQVENWIAERRGDAATLAATSAFVERVRQIDLDERGPLQLVRERLTAMRDAFAYDSIVLLGRQGQVMLTVGKPVDPGEGIAALARRATAAHAVLMSPLYRISPGRLQLSFAVPLSRDGGLDPVGTVLLHVNPESFLLPLVRSWPSAGRSGAAMLARHEGGSLTYLGDAPRSAAPVLTASRKVAGTDWNVVATIEREEVQAGARSLAFWTVVVSSIGVVVVAIALLLLVRQQRISRRLAIEAQSDRLQRQFYDLPFIGMAITAPVTMRWVQFNDHLCTLLGYTREDLATRTWAEMTHPDDLSKGMEEYERAMRGESDGYALEKRFIRKDGSVLFASIDVKVVRKPGGDVDFFVTTVQDITERKQAQERLTHLTQYDVLTNLPNRLLLTDRLNVALAQAQRRGKRLAVLSLDLDRFKTANDTFGHKFGDRLLVEVGTRLGTCLRAADTVSRESGDEFLIVLPAIDTEDDAANVAEKLIAAIARPFVLYGTEVHLTASIGIACFPENGRDTVSLLRNADAAMYSAKAMGRARFELYSAETNARAQERLLLEADLRKAIEREELFLVYQPQVDLATGALIGLEALIRWRHPRRGIVSPVEFIPIAEESGLIARIGAWVLDTACVQHARWRAMGLIDGPVAVNVSALQFRKADFVDAVAAVLARTGLDARYLEIELTESAVMQGIEEVMEKFERLHTLGVRLAVDDFGTGYSSLSYLKQFPLYRLKIDQSFTKGLPQDCDNSAIALAVISLGHSLRLNVLAEGIETPAQEEHLRKLGCDAGQGYLYAKPMPAAECTQFMLSRRAKTHAVPETTLG